MNRAVRWALLSIGLAGVVTAIFVSTGAATPPSMLTNVTLARGTDQSHGTIPMQFGTDFVMSEITVNPGGSSGWHSHPGGAIIVVEQGTLTVYSPGGDSHGQGGDDSHSQSGDGWHSQGCQTTTYTAGQAFIERPGEVDQVINNGTIPYVLFVTFPRVPQGGSARIDQPDPGTCPGI
jgi:quercetin dioxygenase-like cupin family protein